MKKAIYLISIFPLILVGCQKPIVTIEAQDQDVVISECLDIQSKNPDKMWGYLDEQFNDIEKNGWYAVENINENQNIFTSLTEWSNENVKDINLESTSPSADWVRYDDYCFNKDGNVAKLYSDLRTFYGEVQVVRTWEYYSDGSVKSTNIEITDINTQEIIEPDKANYMDNPPYMAENYNDLVEYLEL